MLRENVKLVIWDLDDTFWTGTLAEGGMTPVDRNKDIVVTLAQRGIVSAICSKNDSAVAEAELRRMGMWEWFVFPKIAFGPKGQSIASIIEQANLRPDNVLFIDDNIMGLEEAKHYNPGIMTADPTEILDDLLSLPQLAGKDDASLSRLNQYKSLERKTVERESSSLGNIDFLRQCDIRVEFDYDFAAQFDRVVELANRSNQLNFTKSRFETQAAIEQLRMSLQEYGAIFSSIHVADKYGDYGMVGFYVGNRTARKNELTHFVFSCRAMNMGLEQYVYERLGEPGVKIIQPVANPIKTFEKIDWITEGKKNSAVGTHGLSDRKLLLISGCELLGLASFCSSRREEFVSTVRNGRQVRFDDPGLICGNLDKIEKDQALKQLNYWTSSDAQHLAVAVQSSEIIITALYRSLYRNYFETNDDVLVRIPWDMLKDILKNRGLWFVDNFRRARLTQEQRFDLVAQSLMHLSKAAPPEAWNVTLGVNTRKIPNADYDCVAGWFARLGTKVTVGDMIRALDELEGYTRDLALRHTYNRYLRELCAANSRYIFVDIDALIDDDALGEPEANPDHFTRRGYVAIAEHINGAIRETPGLGAGGNERAVLSAANARLAPLRG